MKPDSRLAGSSKEVSPDLATWWWESCPELRFQLPGILALDERGVKEIGGP